MKLSSLFFVLATIFLGTIVESHAQATPAPLGVTYAGWRGEYSTRTASWPSSRRSVSASFSFVPLYGYTGLNKDRSDHGRTRWRRAIETATAWGSPWC